MCPPLSPPNEISIYSSDEEIFTCLQSMSNGFPLPDNVINYVNPCEHNPSNLPDGFWYLTTTEDTKCRDGFWKPKGKTCEIFRSSSITGWRSTFEFYAGVAPDVLKTYWVMQQYKITQKGQSEDIGPVFGSLCRVFQGGGQGSDHGTQKGSVDATIAEGNNICSRPSVISNTDSSTGQGSKSESQVEHANHETEPLTPTERTLNQPDDPPENWYYSDDDFLELGDLDEPISSSSSSDNSSCLSQTSEDSDTEVGCRFSVAAPRILDKVVLQPSSSGTLTCDDRRELPLELPPKIGSTELPEGKGLKFIGTQDPDNNAEGPSSNPHNLEALSGRIRAASSNGKEKAAAVKKKQQSKKKCSCFPF